MWASENLGSEQTIDIYASAAKLWISSPAFLVISYSILYMNNYIIRPYRVIILVSKTIIKENH